MDADLKFRIITEGQEIGISVTCERYHISRTLYYRWLKRYKTLGIKGLEPVVKQFTPVNKTASEIVAATLNIIKTQPSLGPREVKYRLDAMGHRISESAVYNVMKQHNLTTKEQRMDFSHQRRKKVKKPLPTFENLKSGECWLFWSTFYGHYQGIGDIYEYSILDYKSRIVCSRLYNCLNFANFIDLLTAVAIPVGQSLGFETKHLCFLEHYDIKQSRIESCHEEIRHLFQHAGLEVSIHMSKTLDTYHDFKTIRENYTHTCLSTLMPLIHSGATFNTLKRQLQKRVRAYNMSEPLCYEGYICAPVDFHIQSTNSKLILPLWAYLDRDY